MSLATIARLHRPLTATLAVTLLGGTLFAVASHRHAFAGAVGDVGRGTLLLMTALHVISVLARSEAWAVSVSAAGGTLRRRCAFRVASLSYAANVVSPSLGTAVRIWALRTIARDEAPPARVLAAAEVPVVAIRLLATAVMSVSLVGPLGLPWWIPLVALAASVALLAALARVARRATGMWRGLASLRDGGTCLRIGGCIALTAACETARNLLVLHAVGLNAGPLDAMALLVGAGLLGTLPVGLGTSAGAAMLIFGAAGIGPAAAAGVLLTATAFAADLGYAAWGAGEIAWRACPARLQRRAIDVGAACCGAGLALTAVALT